MTHRGPFQPRPFCVSVIPSAPYSIVTLFRSTQALLTEGSCPQIAESQNGGGWKGPLWGIQSNPLPKQGHLQQAMGRNSRHVLLKPRSRGSGWQCRGRRRPRAGVPFSPPSHTPPCRGCSPCICTQQPEGSSALSGCSHSPGTGTVWKMRP